jgi:hypothetical protein
MTAVFDRTTMALMFEKALKRKKIDVSIVPVPRRYSASCGLACKFPASLLDDVKVLCAAQKIEVKAFHDD